MLFGRDTLVVPGNIVLDRGWGPPPTGSGYFGDRIGDQNPQSNFALQIAAKQLQIAE